MATDLTKERFVELESLAKSAGLQPYDVCFFEVPASLIYEVASYGLPTRYSHWSFGRCVSGDTYVFTQGGMCDIQHVVENLKLNFQSPFARAVINIRDDTGWVQTRYVYKDTAHCLCVKTSSGITLTATPEHPILCLHNGKLLWVHMEDLCPGDSILSPIGTKIFGNRNNFDFQFKKPLYSVSHNHSYKNIDLPQQMDKKLAFLCGILSAEGVMTTKNCLSVCIGTQETELRQATVDAFLSVFNIKHCPVVRDEDYTLKYDSTILRQFFEYLGMDYVRSCQKLVPQKILESSEECIESYLCGLFEGGGNVNSRSVELCLCSKKMIQQIQLILLNLGIMSTTRFDIPAKSGKNSVVQKEYIKHRLWITNYQNLYSFKNKIGFVSSIKKSKLDSACFHRKTKKSDTRIFKEAKPIIRKIYKNCKNRQIDTELKYAYQNALVYNPTEDNIRTIINRTSEDTSLLKILLNYVCLDVISIDEAGEKTVYDFTIPITHKFLTNGIISHNTYQHQRIQGEMGFSKIYELILNNDPSYAFLDKSNTSTTNLLIAAHCYLPGTYVQTLAGIKLIEEVQSGERVYNCLGKITNVKHPTCDVFDGEIITIQAGSYKFSQTSDHQLYVIQTSSKDRTKYRSWAAAFDNLKYKPKWVVAGDLKPGDFLVVNKIRLCDNVTTSDNRVEIPISKVRCRREVSELLTIEKDGDFGELIGLYLADGYARPHGQMGLYFHINEKHLHNRSIELLNKCFNLQGKIKYKPEQNSAVVEFNEVCIAAFLREHIGYSCYNRTLPHDWLYHSSHEFLRGVLKGFLLGDGTKSDDRSMGYTTTSSVLAMQIQQIAMHFGIFFGINPRDKSTESQSRHISFDGLACGIYDNKVRELLDMPHREVSRTWSGVIESSNCFYVKINLISSDDYHGIVHCLSVDNANSFTLANGIVTHNCLAHSDMFKNNILFKQNGETNMIAVAKRHAKTIDQFRNDYGDDEVDEWLDVALSLERHIDVYRGLRRKRYSARQVRYKERTASKWEDIVDRNPEPLVKKIIEGIYIPPHPEKDLLWFLSEYANLESWQQKIFQIVRRESYYFYPQFRTRILNEGWACISSDTKILTEHGLLRIDEYNSHKHENTKCYDGEEFVNRSDTYTTEEQDGLFILTNRGLSIKCANNHRFQAEDGRFVKAKDLKIDTNLRFVSGVNKWSEEVQYVEYEYISKKQAHRDVNTIGQIVFDEKFAKFVAFWIGEGCTSKNQGIYIRNSNKVLLIELGEYIKDIFSINYVIRCVKDGGSERYNLEFYSRALFTLFEHICDGHKKSRQKRIPNIVFKSPKSVVAAFLRSLFDAEGCIYNRNCEMKSVIFTTSSLEMMNDVTILLSNFGIYGNLVSCKKNGYKDVYQLKLATSCLKLYAKEVGFDDPNKSEKLNKILKECTFNKVSTLHTSKVVRIEQIRDVFYDFTVPDKHVYTANSLVHHNSYWHAELMHQYWLGNDNDYGVRVKYPLTDEEHLDFLSSHEKVVQPGLKIPLKVEIPEIDTQGRLTGRVRKSWNPQITNHPGLFSKATRLNPYYVGFCMLRDIKKRWDEYYKEGYREDEWGKEIPVMINGAQKIREVMKEEDDISFLRNYLTEELVKELHLFGYGNVECYDDNYGIQQEIQKRLRDNQEEHLGQIPIDEQYITNKTIAVGSKNIKNIVNLFAKSSNNYGVPTIVVRRVDEAGLLRLEHVIDDSVNIDINYAEHVLRYIGRVWGRPVELVRKDKDKTWVLGFDGIQFDINYESDDYPECIELQQSPSSW